MKKILTKISFIFIIFLSSHEIYAKNYNKILIQINGKYLTLKQAAKKKDIKLIKHQGSLSFISRNQIYPINEASISYLFPNRIKLDIILSNTLPQAKIYLDRYYIGVVTDKDGNACVSPTYLKKNKHILKIERQEIKKIFRFDAIKNMIISCTGTSKFKCKIS